MDRPSPRVPHVSGVAWIIAALLVLVAAVAGGYLLDRTNRQADEERLVRGSEAVELNIETEIRTLEMVVGGIDALATESFDPHDLTKLAVDVDANLLASLVAVVTYPITDDGIGNGESLIPIRPSEDVTVPALHLSPDEGSALVAQDRPFLSAAYQEEGKPGVRMIAVVPALIDNRDVLLGAIFLVDHMVEQALVAAGVNRYAASVIDTRFNDQVIVTVGTPSRSSTVRIAPLGLAGLVDIVVMPGREFPFSSSNWTRFLSLAVGLTIGSLILALGRMARARAKEMEQKLILAEEHDRSKDRFVATVSHELRTPLSVVLGAASELSQRRGFLEPEEETDLLAMVSEQAQEAATMVEDLLVAARSEYQHVRVVPVLTNLHEHLEYATEWIPPDREEGLVMTADDPQIYADVTRLRQIIRNLLQNAVRHGGPNIRVDTMVEGSTVHLTVRDDGPPISPADCERIFEPYTRVSRPGSTSPLGVGIGLYVSRLLARLMGGDLVCTRDEGLTEFRLTLPSHAPGDTNADAATAVAVV